MRQRWSCIPDLLETVTIPGLGEDSERWVLGPSAQLVPPQSASKCPTAAIRAWFACVVDVGKGGIALLGGRDGIVFLIQVPRGTFTDCFDDIGSSEVMVVADLVDSLCTISFACGSWCSTSRIAAPRREDCRVVRRRISDLRETKRRGKSRENDSETGDDSGGGHFIGASNVQASRDYRNVHSDDNGDRRVLIAYSLLPTACFITHSAEPRSQNTAWFHSSRKQQGNCWPLLFWDDGSADSVGLWTSNHAAGSRQSLEHIVETTKGCSVFGEMVRTP